jgi:hypothetical protein
MNINTLLNKKKENQHIETQLIEKLNQLGKINSDSIEIGNKIKFYTNLLSFYNNKIKIICNSLKQNCTHIIVTDSIDITPDDSQNVTYCELCETTF